MTDQASPPPGLLSGRQTLTAAMRLLGCVLWCADANGTIHEIDDGATALLRQRGLLSLTALPASIEHAIDKERVADFRAAYAAYAAGKSQTLDMTCLFAGQDGQQSLWRICGLRRKRIEGVTYIFGMLVPVQGTGPLQPVLDLIPHMIAIKDRRGRLLLANQPVVEHLGKPLEHIVGRHQSELQHDPAEAAFILADDQRVLAEGTQRAVTNHTFTDAAGACHILQTTKLPYRLAELDEQVVLSVSVDMTEQKRIEQELHASTERFRLLADNAPGVIYQCRYDGNYATLYLNDAVEPLCGHPKEEFLSGRMSFVSLCHPKDIDRITSIINDAVAARSSFEIDYRIRHRDGEYRWVRDFGVGVFDREQLMMLEGFILDITQQRRTLDALEAAHTQLAARVEKNAEELEDATEMLHRRTTERNAVEAMLNRRVAEDRQFHEALKSLNAIGHAMSSAKSSEEIALIAVERGLAELRLGRMSIWLRDFDAENYVITGTYGTDEQGNIRDERDARITVGLTSPVGVVLSQQATIWRDRDVPVFNHRHEIVGRGERLVAALWDGERVIGTLATDTLTLGRPYPERMIEIVQLFGTTVAHHMARVRNMQAIEESAVKLNRITTAMPGAVYQFIRDAHGGMRFTYLSEIIEDLTELPASHFMNDVMASVELMLPEYRQPFLRSVEQSAATLEPWTLDYRIRTPSGRIRWLRGSSIAEPHKSDGTIVWNGVLLDITDRKHAELALLENDERHRSLIAALAEGIVVINPDGTVREANRAAERIFARMKDDMSERGNNESLVKIRDESGNILTLKEWPSVYTFETGKPVTDAIMFITTPERPEGFWLSCNTQPMVRHGERKPFAVVATLRDITEQRRIEAERRQLEAELQQAQRIETVGELAGGIAHDFNNLLTAIFSYTENAKSHLAADDAAYQSIVQAEKVAHEARTITTSLLTFCRKSTSVREPVRINDVVGDSIRMVGHMRKHNVDIRTQLDRTETLSVMADPTQLRQMMINLMINAIDAMPQGGTLTIRGSSRATDDGGLNVSIDLTDTGTGIAEGDLHRIFEPFFTTRPRGRGTGLGLAIVHGIIRSLAGTIDVKSTVGSGTTMTIELPAFHRSANAVPTPVERSDVASVLLMTQDAFVRNMVRSWLKRGGFHAIAVRSLDDLLDVSASAVIVDVADSDDDTASRCRDIHHRIKHTPIVILGTAAGVDELRDEINVHILRKPYKMAELIELLRRITTSVQGGDI